METFTMVMPSPGAGEGDLALLRAPVHTSGPSDAPAGFSEGVVLDEEGKVTAFIVRLDPSFAEGAPRVLVPATAVAHAEEGALCLSWPAARVLGLPRLDEDLRPLEPLPGDVPVLPPTPAEKAGVQSVEWAVAGAALGALFGMILGGPLGALSLAVLFATGGVVAGAAPAAGPAPRASRPPRDARPDEVKLLDVRLGDPALVLTGIVHATRVLPMIPSHG